MRRPVAILALVVGVVLVAIPIAYSMFDRTEKAERILDRFTFLTLGDNPDRYLAEAEVTRDGSSELVATAIPQLARQAGIEQAEQAERFPALARAQTEVPEAFDFSVRYSEQLDAVKDKFSSVYDIPVPWLALTVTPWLFLLAGLACVAGGIAALRTGGRGPIVFLGALGVALALGPVAFGAIGKSADGEDVKDFAERGLTEMAATAAVEASDSLDAAVIETEGEILPAVAAARGISEQELAAELDSRFPDSALFLEEWDVIGPRLSRLATAVDESTAEFESAGELPIAFPVWLLIGSGLLLAGFAGAALREAADGVAAG